MRLDLVRRAVNLAAQPAYGFEVIGHAFVQLLFVTPQLGEAIRCIRVRLRIDARSFGK